MATFVLIGIAGGTGSGKTTIAERIVQAIGEERAVIISQDSYYLDRGHLPPKEREKINYDHPSSFETELLIDHLMRLKRGEAIPRLSYDYKTHCRRETGEMIPAKEVVVVEGIMLLENEELRSLFDVKIYVDTDADVRIIRRIKRDVQERGRSLEEVTRQYLESVRPMHLEFVEPSKRYADVIIPGDEYNPVAVDIVVSRIKSLLSGRNHGINTRL